MKIESFGGLTDKSVTFTPGLNVVLGPNEAGKSTLFEGIRHVLLTPAKLGKSTFRRKLANFLPIGGGDTIGCRLSFECAGGTYRLMKSWGASPEAELVLPDGSRLTEDGAVARAVEELLPAGEGTVRSVLLTFQSGLARTLEELKKNPDAVASFDDVLRRAVLETDKVSVGSFLNRVEQLHTDQFEHWDMDGGKPEKGRGYSNPYKRPGRVLGAYYRYQELSQRQREVAEMEEAFGEKNRRLEKLQCKEKEQEGFLERHKKAAADCSGRRELEARIDSVRLEAELLQKDYGRWPVLLHTIEEINGKLPRLREKSRAFEDEKERAEVADRQRELVELFRRVSDRKRRLDECEQKLLRTAALPKEELEKIRSLASKLERLKAALGASRMDLALSAKKDLTVTVAEGLGEPAERRIAAGSTLKLQVEGEARLTGAEWDLHVGTGENYHELTAAHVKAMEDLKGRLSAIGVESLGEAEEAGRVYLEASGDVASARLELERELEGRDYEELERETAASLPSGAARPLAEVMVELTTAERDLEDALAKAAEKKEELHALIEKHNSLEELFQRIVDQENEKKSFSERLSQLEPVPEGFDDAEAFTRQYEEKSQAVQELRTEINGLKIDIARAETEMSDESAEEIEHQRVLAEEAYERELATGEALVCIRRASEDILAGKDSQSLSGFATLVSGYIKDLTGGRYERARMSGSLPDGLIRGDGGELSYPLLSAGTKDGMALALRLAMARQYLSDSDGFLILDDPLVDLDPERQALAADLISRYAQNRQLILFTCHPDQAARFAGGGRVDLTELWGTGAREGQLA
jgi:exonuclease SbcC